jgi:hypothetical protein
MLSNGSGGLDWSGFDLAVAKFGIEDVDGLIERLHVIKAHRPPDEELPSQA